MGHMRRHGTRAVSVHRYEGGSGREDACWVVDEEPLTIEVEGIGSYTLMWTPTEPVGAPCGFMPDDGVLAEGGVPEILALAAGFSFTEGLFDRLADIRSLAVCPDNPGVVRLVLADPRRAQVRRRNVVVGSSCGICGGREQIEAIVGGIPPVGDSLRLEPGRLGSIMAAMRQRQSVWLATGGTHAAAIFDGGGRILVLAEDLGRHNALDKAIGHCLLAGLPLAGCGTALTSRVTLEMASKAARAGLELVAAVSAASTLAIEVTDRFGITLCGFVRHGRATAFTHGRRLLAKAAGPAAGQPGKPIHIA
ncbi:MAG: formate dehydrogenase accessory sulfurtransferase FdhD [Burkholderiales bacterium]|nr:formate dehydrogenase accessory sulfurtransferase FdhD [Zoogloeaceae bacterium]MBP9654427.1 formate dehydrogenase accessory sulfurtransferase FdhD [Rhodocyclaceae bacterium]MCZ2174915.1 formate dehydrogenase accessory sulfurtransferase FdhD [Burkholderiales bacterium]HNQ58663.1 formate dehydrogenase accessory sulfurtransferase FdhD [Candidatus Desulfobacillus denitrificans]MBV6410090.1 Sulfur carrier protein FdhD [Rhodocyclaceae bacterium]